jgi:hypothetical protein
LQHIHLYYAVHIPNPNQTRATTIFLSVNFAPPWNERQNNPQTLPLPLPNKSPATYLFYNAEITEKVTFLQSVKATKWLFFTKQINKLMPIAILCQASRFSTRCA